MSITSIQTLLSISLLEITWSYYNIILTIDWGHELVVTMEVGHELTVTVVVMHTCEDLVITGVGDVYKPLVTVEVKWISWSYTLFG